MGNRRENNPRAISAPSELETPHLQSQLEAQITRTSLLQRRLNDTLDTLDALTQSHDQEVATLTYSNKRLRRKLDQYIEYARNLESERDQLREGARQIVEQEPRPRSPFVEPPHNVDDYAKLIVQNLRTELEQERQAHTLDRETSEKEILSLRAKLARREAELESCIYHTGADRNFWHEIPDEKPPSRATSSTRRVKDTQASRDSSRRIPASSLTRDEMAQILGIAGARNRSLEGDIYGLSESIQRTRVRDGEAHTAAHRSHSRDEIPLPTSTSTPRAGPSQIHKRPGSSNQPMSPRPSARSTPTTSNGRRNHDNTDSESYLQQFRDELQRLEEAIAGFASERGEMKRVLEDYAVILDDHVVPKHSLGTLQQGQPPSDPIPPPNPALPSTRTHRSPKPSSNSTPRPTTNPKSNTRIPTPQPSILDGNLTEESMDLASPLQPTILFTDDNWTGFRVVEPDIDASQIPLPESPVEDDHADDTDESTRHDDSGVLMQDSEFSSPNRTPPAETINLNQSDVDGGDGGIHSRSHSLTPVSMIQPTQVEVAVLLERLGELERELREAREEMEEREKELMQMRSVLEGLGVQVSVGRIGT